MTLTNYITVITGSRFSKTENPNLNKGRTCSIQGETTQPTMRDFYSRSADCCSTTGATTLHWHTHLAGEAYHKQGQDSPLEGG